MVFNQKKLLLSLKVNTKSHRRFCFNLKAWWWKKQRGLQSGAGKLSWIGVKSGQEIAGHISWPHVQNWQPASRGNSPCLSLQRELSNTIHGYSLCRSNHFLNNIIPNIPLIVCTHTLILKQVIISLLVISTKGSISVFHPLGRKNERKAAGGFQCSSGSLIYRLRNAKD